MATNNQTLIFETRKSSTAALRADLLDENGHTVAGSTLSALKLTLKNGGTYINGREAQDVLQKNGCTVDEAGHLIWIMDPKDNPVQGAVEDGATEEHKATFLWQWAGGAKIGQLDLLIRVFQNVDVPNVP
jgi:hypothetical protein